MSQPTYLTCIGNDTAELIDNEIFRAKQKHPGTFNSKHEGYAVLLEEVDELWDEVKKDGSKARMKSEAVQVAAMAIRFINELT